MQYTALRMSRTRIDSQTGNASYRLAQETLAAPARLLCTTQCIRSDRLDLMDIRNTKFKLAGAKRRTWDMCIEQHGSPRAAVRECTVGGHGNFFEVSAPKKLDANHKALSTWHPRPVCQQGSQEWRRIFKYLVLTRCKAKLKEKNFEKREKKKTTLNRVPT